MRCGLAYLLRPQFFGSMLLFQVFVYLIKRTCPPFKITLLKCEILVDDMKTFRYKSIRAIRWDEINAISYGQSDGSVVKVINLVLIMIYSTPIPMEFGL